jgi:hypothetical protein
MAHAEALVKAAPSEQRTDVKPEKKTSQVWQQQEAEV